MTYRFEYQVSVNFPYCSLKQINTESELSSHFSCQPACCHRMWRRWVIKRDGRQYADYAGPAVIMHR